MDEDFYTSELWDITLGEAFLNGVHVKFDVSPYIQEGHVTVLKISPHRILVVSRERLSQAQALAALNSYYEAEALKEVKVLKV